MSNEQKVSAQVDKTERKLFEAVELKPFPPQQLSDSEVDLESEFKNDFEYFLKRSDNRLQYQSNKGLRLSELKALWMLGYKAAPKTNS